VTLSTDLGGTKTLSKVSVLWAGDTTNNYDLQMSADNVNWTTVASGATNNTTPQIINTTTFSSTPTGRYFRIVAKNRWNIAYGNSIYEIGLYGTGSTTPNPTPPTPTPPTSKSPDLNGDGKVNLTDLSLLLSQWSKPGSTDLNNNGSTDLTDLSIMLGAWKP
jgi:F5/8 type C domain